MDRDATTRDQIKAIYYLHQDRYGYRRITATLRGQGSLINYKPVQRLMEELKLKSLVHSMKYRSHRWQLGRIAPNLIHRNFEAPQPNEKRVTAVTEFKVDGKKRYLSSVMDLFDSEIP